MSRYSTAPISRTISAWFVKIWGNPPLRSGGIRQRLPSTRFWSSRGRASHVSELRSPRKFEGYDLPARLLRQLAGHRPPQRLPASAEEDRPARRRRVDIAPPD